MTATRIVPAKYWIIVGIVAVALLLLLIWFGVGGSFGWRDVFVGIVGAGVWCLALATFSKHHKGASFSGRFPRFVFTFIEYFCVFGVIYMIPAFDLHFLHPLTATRHGFLEAFSQSLFMGLGFAIFSLFRDSPPSTIVNTAPSVLKLVSIFPLDVRAGEPNFTLSMNGAGFTQDMVLLVDGNERPFQFVNSDQIMLLITAEDIARPGKLNIVVHPNGMNGTSPRNEITSSFTLRVN